MKRIAAYLLAFAAGCVLTSHYTQWRVGAAQGREALYALGAAQAFAQLDACQNPQKGWFKQ